MKKCRFITLALLVFTVFLTALCTAAEDTPAADLSSSCNYQLSFKASHAEASLKDDNTETYQKFKPGTSLTLSWPDTLQPSFVYVQWTVLPDSYIFTQYNAAGKKEVTESVPFRFNEVLYLEPDTVKVVFSSKADMNYTTCRVYGPGTPPEDFHPYEPIPDKIDYLIIAMHPDDDVLFMGGIMPTLTERGLNGAILYLGTRVRERCDEALNGAWIMGAKYHPILAGFPDIPNTTFYYDKFQNTFRVTDVEKYLVGIIRHYKPDVIFSHDTEGEYGHWQHKRLSQAVQLAVQDCSNPDYDKKSASLYGTYTVKKCYLHLYPKNPITVSMTVPLSSYGNRTALDIATEAFTCHSSQHNGNHAVTNKGIYSLENFGLFYTTVGPDNVGGDFFEHVLPVSQEVPAYTPIPTAEPVLSTPVPTVEPTPRHLTPSPTETTDPNSNLNGAQSVSISVSLELQATATPLCTPSPSPVPAFTVGGKTVYADEEELYLASSDDMMLLSQFPSLKKVDCTAFSLDTETAYEAVKRFPDITFSFTLSAFGMTISADTELLDLHGRSGLSLDLIEKTVMCLPNLKKVDMRDCGFSNDQMGTLFDKFPHVRFVWVLDLKGRKLRTDAVGFSTKNPGKYTNEKSSESYKKAVKAANSKRLYTEDIQVLRYCPDLVALDLGHNYIDDLSVLQYLPHLQILIIADNKITDISVFSMLPELVYVEFFMNAVTDISPLSNHEKLLDLNFCHNKVTDLSPLLTMPQLERVWCSANKYDRSYGKEIQAQMPDCIVDYTARDDTDDGWRDHERYEWMRAYVKGEHDPS